MQRITAMAQRQVDYNKINENLAFRLHMHDAGLEEYTLYEHVLV